MKSLHATHIVILLSLAVIHPSFQERAFSQTPTPTPEPIRELITDFYQGILGRAPEAGAVDSWETGYFDYALSFNIDVRFVPREMARLIFLSQEYANRNRTDSDFITDCYQVFLDRDPSPTELNNWITGVWNRSQVMTIFSESEEFATRIQNMYPGKQGNATRNFVTTLYIGLLDRLVDRGGLEYATGLFDAAHSSGGNEAVRAQAKQMGREVIASAEFLGKEPAAPDHVTRFYRAFLGRFPSDSEVTYWSGMVTGGSATYDSLIHLFGDSVEFTSRIGPYFGDPTPTATSFPTATPTPGQAGEESTVYLPGNVPLVLVRIPAGSFQMGRYSGEQDSSLYEDPQHTVSIGYAFTMGKCEVTKAQWQAVMGTTPWSGLDCVLNDSNSPAVYVSWNDIAASGGFIEKLNQHIFSSTGQGSATFRLPSEAEWEYACRAGTQTRFYWGDDPSETQIGDYAWYMGNTWDADEAYAHVVGLKLSNAWGLHDMSGNVWEWCQDWWHDSYSGAPTNGSAWELPIGSYRALRGGHWLYNAGHCRSAYRHNCGPDSPGVFVGFRLVRTQN